MKKVDVGHLHECALGGLFLFAVTTSDIVQVRFSKGHERSPFEPQLKATAPRARSEAICTNPDA
jgi:hypothetical protein